MQRQILHLRVPSFPVAVYQVKDPALRDRPVIVAAGIGPRATVLSISAQAAREGVLRGMTLSEAQRRCRKATVLPPDPPLFDRADRALAELLARFSPLVEPRRGGRLFADLTGTGRMMGPALDAARRIQKEVERVLRLGPSAGLGANKLVSGVAARLLAPVSLTDVAHGREADFLSPLPVGHLPAVVPEVEGRLLDELNIRKVKDLAEVALPHLHAAFGDRGPTLYRQARGIDASPVHPPERTPCVEADVTFAEDTNDDGVLLTEALRLVESCGRRLRASGMSAGRLRLTARYSDGVLSSRHSAVAPAACLDLTLFARLRSLFPAVVARRGRVRFLRLRLDRLGREPRQAFLFPEPASRAAAHERELMAALDRIRGRFGGEAITFGQAAGAAAPATLPPRILGQAPRDR